MVAVRKYLKGNVSTVSNQRKDCTFTQVFLQCPSVVGVYELGCHFTGSPVMAEFRLYESKSLSWKLDETEQPLLTEVVLMSVKLSSE